MQSSVAPRPAAACRGTGGGQCTPPPLQLYRWQLVLSLLLIGGSALVLSEVISRELLVGAFLGASITLATVILGVAAPIKAEDLLTLLPQVARAGVGHITLCGAGPGGPALMTLAAHQALAAADVVICDKIASPELHSLVRKGAVLKIAEKIPGNADAAQAELNAWGIDALRGGKRVVRLKVGDPYLYGRGGEEWAFYRSHGFTPEVLPGVTSALLAPLVAGIPVTHRGVANSVLITTGQGRGGTSPALPPFDAQRTLVMLMGVGRIPNLLGELGALGYPVDTPVAIVERAAHPDQRVTTTYLTRLAADAAAVGVSSPAVLIIGRAVHAQREEEAKVVAKHLEEAGARTVCVGEVRTDAYGA